MKLSMGRGMRLVGTLVVLTCVGCRERPGGRWDWERMRSQPRYEAYGASAFFPDGKAMQAPPAGTVARDVLEPSMQSVGSGADVHARGANQFRIFCAVCHGDDGGGQSLVGSNMDPPAPPALTSARVRALTDQQLYAVITDGFGRMPSYRSQLSPADRAAVVAYVRELEALPRDTASTPGFDTIP